MIRLILIGALLLLAQLAIAQVDCAVTPTPEDTARMRQVYLKAQQYHAFKANIAIDKYMVPVQIHVVRKTDGTGGMTTAQVASVMSDLNAYYDDANIEFYECSGIAYIDDDTYYYFNNNPDEANIASSNNVLNVVNIYFTGGSLIHDGNSVCGYSYVLVPASYQLDHLFVLNSCAINDKTLIHEMGHYFGLMHTHQSANENVTRNPADSCYNCLTAGDWICDTEASPELTCYGNVNNSTSCTYTGTTLDACGASYTPQTNNMMAYGCKPCRNTFTSGQYDLMRTGYETVKKYLRCCETNRVVTIAMNGIHNVEVSGYIAANNTISSISEVVYDAKDSITLADGFQAGEGSKFTALIDGCGARYSLEHQNENPLASLSSAAFGNRQVQLSGVTGVGPLPKGFAFGVYPNPVATGSVQITYSTLESSVNTLSVYNLFGQQVVTVLAGKLQLPGTYAYSVDTRLWPAGTYCISWYSETGLGAVQKLVVMK